jgi:hypothetical protein
MEDAVNNTDPSPVGTRGLRTQRGNRIDKKYLYRMLSNRVYIGEAVHKGESYPGEHDAIIDRETWDKVHAILQESPRKPAKHSCALSRTIPQSSPPHKDFNRACRSQSVALLACIPERRISALRFRSGSRLPNAPGIEVLSHGLEKASQFLMLARDSPNRRSHEVWRISAPRDRLLASCPDTGAGA